MVRLFTCAQHIPHYGDRTAMPRVAIALIAISLITVRLMTINLMSMALLRPQGLPAL